MHTQLRTATRCVPRVMDTPWLTRAEAARWARCDPKTIWTALIDYERTGGTAGLRGIQRTANGRWKIHRDDLEKWMAGRESA